MGLLDLVPGRAGSGPVEYGSDGDWWRSAYTPWPGVLNDSAEVPYVTEEMAAGLPGIGRGVELIAGVIGQMRAVRVRQLDQPHVSTEILSTPPLLVNPDPQWHGREAWLSAVSASLAWYGNAFAYRGAEVSDRRGFPLRLPLLRPESMSYGSTDPRLASTYKYSSGSGDSVEMDAGDVLHMVLGARAGRVMGQGILARYQTELKLMIATEQGQYVLMKDGRPLGIVSLDADVTQQQATDAKGAFLDAIRQDSVAVLGRATWQSVQYSSNDLSMVPTREFNLRLASDIVGVPPYLLGVPVESRVYSNMENEWTNFVRITLGKYLSAIQAGLSQCFPSGTSVLLQTDDLLRADSKTRWDTYAVANGLGAITVEEIRTWEGLPDLPELPAVPPVAPVEDAPTPAAEEAQ